MYNSSILPHSPTGGDATVTQIMESIPMPPISAGDGCNEKKISNNPLRVADQKKKKREKKKRKKSLVAYAIDRIKNVDKVRRARIHVSWQELRMEERDGRMVEEK